ncbi:MAG: efflux RND transporter periplasmic adaptor subunit [Verrucomicrobiales bacterium]
MKTSLFHRTRRSALAAFAAAVLLAHAAHAQSGSWALGITEAINDVTLSSSLPGILGNRVAKEGDFVKAGAAVVDLDKRLEELEVERRKYVLDLRKTDLDSTKSLFEKKAISVSREEMDKKVAEYAVAQVEYELAKEQLRRRQLTAPFDGVVTALLADPGEACQAQQPLVRVVDTRKCYFIVNIDAKTGYKLKAGQPVKLEVDAGDKPETFSGVVNYIAPVVDPASGLLRVRVVFENPEGKIRPGVAGRMLLEEGKNA